jgi:hypothetical protein
MKKQQKTSQEDERLEHGKRITEEMTVENLLAIRREEGLKIEPATAEVSWWYALTLDPYGVYPELSEEEQIVGKVYFARRPGSEVWVEFGDLPEKTRAAIWNQPKIKWVFPPGLKEFHEEVRKELREQETARYRDGALRTQSSSQDQIRK